jgi:starvation-inducible DNA-binding protein
MTQKNPTTRIDMPVPLRARMVGLLNQQLADGLDLNLQLKHAHWNVKGPGFASLHALYDELAEDLEELVDELAERAVELSGTAGGTVQVVHAATRLPAYPLQAAAGREHNQALASALAAFAATARVGIEAAANAGDAGTADLFTQVSRAVDKMLWKVEAHLEASE